MIFDDQRCLKLINDAPNDYTIKFFFYLAFNQPQNDIEGYKINKKQFQFDLKLGKSTFFNSLQWLKENLFVNELKLDDCSDFMVNPYIVMNNSDRDVRIAEWKRRIRLDDERIAKNRELKRRRELKKQNQS